MAEAPAPETPTIKEETPKPAEAVTLEQIEAAKDPHAEFDRRQVEFTARVARPGHISGVVGGLVIILTKDGSMRALLGGSPFVTAVFGLIATPIVQRRPKFFIAESAKLELGNLNFQVGLRF